MDASVKDRERINPYKLFLGSFVPNWLLARRELSPGAKLTFARLAQFAGRRGIAYPRQATLARELGISVRQLRRHLGALVRVGLVESARPSRTRATRYTFHRHVWMTGRERTHLSPRERTHLSPRLRAPSNDRARAAVEENQTKRLTARRGGSVASDRDDPRAPIPAAARETLARLGLLRLGAGGK